MSRLSHLESFRLRIKTLSPVYIGSGIKLNKKEYIYIPNGHRIFFVHFDKLVAFLDQKNLLPLFEQFMLGQYGNIGLYEWMQQQKITRGEYPEFTHYAISAGDAVGIGTPFREIHMFIKNAQGEPYFPGSSIKGALRTTIAAKMLKDQRPRFAKTLPEIEGEVNRQRKGKYFLKPQMDNLDKVLFKTLNLTNKPMNAVNDILVIYLNPEVILPHNQ
jgi:CRISPR-associated protein Csm5